MEKLSKLWWLFALLGTCATFLNPYIGLFGSVNGGEIFTLICLEINIIARVKAFKKNSESKMLKVSLKSLGIMTYIIAIVFFLIKIFVAFIIFIIGYTSNEIMTPYEIWSNPHEMGIMFLIVEMIFNILLMLSYIYRGKSIRRLVRNYE